MDTYPYSTILISLCTNKQFKYIYPKLLATRTIMVYFNSLYIYIYIASLILSNSQQIKQWGIKTQETQHVGPSNPMSWHCFTWRPIYVDLVCHTAQSLAIQYSGVAFIQQVSYMTQDLVTQYPGIVFIQHISYMTQYVGIISKFKLSMAISYV